MKHLPVAPIGLPGLAMLSLCGALFILALLVARARRGPADTGTGQRAATSWGGIIVQMIGFACVGFGPFRVTLDPLSGAALGEATLVGVLMASAVGLFFTASRTMGANWAIVASTRSDHRLVTTGPFAYVRNPIYVALFLFMLGLSVAYEHYAGLLLGIPLYWLGTMMRVRIEERLLRTQFGADYDAYAARVKRFVPSLV